MHLRLAQSNHKKPPIRRLRRHLPPQGGKAELNLFLSQWKAKAWISLMLLSGLVTLYAPCFAKTAVDPHQVYEDGVMLYRHGDYAHALEDFKTSTDAMPESQEARYYYAITLAQLGRFEEARNAYQAVITIAPNSPSAELAKQGLAFLPDPKALDAPPHFQQATAASTPAPTPTTAQNPNAGGMDSKAMQMMMMMSSMGGGSGGAFNPMMLPLMEQMGKGQTGQNGTGAADDASVSPETYSTMMMNQMMQNMDFFGKNNKDE